MRSISQHRSTNSSKLNLCIYVVATDYWLYHNKNNNSIRSKHKKIKKKSGFDRLFPPGLCVWLLSEGFIVRVHVVRRTELHRRLLTACLVSPVVTLERAIVLTWNTTPAAGGVWTLHLETPFTQIQWCSVLRVISSVTLNETPQLWMRMIARKKKRKKKSLLLTHALAELSEVVFKGTMQSWSFMTQNWSNWNVPEVQWY